MRFGRPTVWEVASAIFGLVGVTLAVFDTEFVAFLYESLPQVFNRFNQDWLSYTFVLSGILLIIVSAFPIRRFLLRRSYPFLFDKIDQVIRFHYDENGHIKADTIRKNWLNIPKVFRGVDVPLLNSSQFVHDPTEMDARSFLNDRMQYQAIVYKKNGAPNLLSYDNEAPGRFEPLQKLGSDPEFSEYRPLKYNLKIPTSLAHRTVYFEEKLVIPSLFSDGHDHYEYSIYHPVFRKIVQFEFKGIRPSWVFYEKRKGGYVGRQKTMDLFYTYTHEDGDPVFCYRKVWRNPEVGSQIRISWHWDLKQ